MLCAAAAAVCAACVAWLLVQTPSQAASVPLSISIQGNHFVNGAGQTIRLLGVNHPSSEYACVDGFGYNDGHQDAADAAAVASWNANAVRVPLNEDCWLGINGQPNNSEGPPQPLTAAGYQQAVENYVAALNAHGLYAILDLHWTAPGCAGRHGTAADARCATPPTSGSRSPPRSRATRPSCSTSSTSPIDPTDPRSGDDGNAADAVTWGCWASGTKPDAVGGGAPPVPCFTQAYDDNGNPTTRYQVVGMQTLVDTIRNAGATQPVMVGGLDYANDLSQWADHAPNDPLNQEAASFHNYMGKDCDNVACWNSQIAPIAANVPVVTGEFDEDNYLEPKCATKTPSTFDSDYMTWADQHGVGYLAWGWWVLSQDEKDAAGCSAFYLLNSYDGTPRRPTAPPCTITCSHCRAAVSQPGRGPTGPTTTAKPPVKLKTFGVVGEARRGERGLHPALGAELLRQADRSDGQQIRGGHGEDQAPHGLTRLGAVLAQGGQGQEGHPEAVQSLTQAAGRPPPAQGADHAHADGRHDAPHGRSQDDHAQAAAHPPLSPAPSAGSRTRDRPPGREFEAGG